MSRERRNTFWNLSVGSAFLSTKELSFGGEHGPYRQSERRDIYKKYVQELLDAGKAYIAFDTPEELEAKRQEIQNFQYDASTRGMMRNSLSLPADEVERLLAEGRQYVVRSR